MDAAHPNAIATELNALAERHGWPMRCDGELAFDRRELRELCDLWWTKGAGTVPSRAELDLRALKPYARNLTILERSGDGHTAHRYRFRLFGSTLALLFGEHTGRYLDEMVQAALVPSWTVFYDCVLSHRLPFRFINYYQIPNRDFLKGEIFAAPLADHEGDVRMVMAATYVGLNDAAPAPLG